MQIIPRLTQSTISLVLICVAATAFAQDSRTEVKLVQKGHSTSAGDSWTKHDGYIQASGKQRCLLARHSFGRGDFKVHIRLRMQGQKKSAAAFFLDGNQFGFEGNRETFFVSGPIFDGLQLLSKSTDTFERESWIDFVAQRTGKTIVFSINGEEITRVEDGGRSYRQFGLLPWRSTMQVSDATVIGNLYEPPPLPDVVDVFVPKQDGFPAIRIPALVTTQEGTLLAFAEGRQGGDHSQNDIVVKRSTDAGKTWSKVQVIHEAGKLSLNNPQPVVLPSGRVLLMYQRSSLGEFKAKPGYGSDSYFTFTQYSDDDGQTWSKPKDVSKSVKRAERVTSVASGPGIGIVLQRGKHKGRVVMPFNQGPFGDWRVYAAYSDDNGETWTIGENAPEDGKGHGNEVQMVELSDGRVMLNARTQGKGGTRHRKIAWSEDGGHSWTQLQDDLRLIEPVCQASILRYSWPEDGGSRIIFSNPASKTGRVNGVVRLSEDEGRTWSKSRVVYPGSFAYSCLTKMKDGRIGLLFERNGYGAISFITLSIESLTKPESESTDD